MTVTVSVTSTPTVVSVTNNVVSVALTTILLAVTLSAVGPQGATGPQGPAGSTFVWNEITTSSQQMQAANGYIANNASRVVLTLPATSSVGDEISVTGKGAGGWIIAQNAGQVIHFGTDNTTSGTGGSLASQNVFDGVNLVCITANSDWNVLTAQGNLTVT